MICAICLASGLPLYPEVVDLGKPTRAAGSAITIRDGVALCLDHYRKALP